LENLGSNVDVNEAWETIRENIKFSATESLGYYEPKENKPWFDEECSKLLDQRKQANLQRLQDPREINGDNLNNIRREHSYFSNYNSCSVLVGSWVRISVERLKIVIVAQALL
jgi:hypothetical protein